MSIEDTTLPFKLPADWRSTFVGNEFFLTLGKMLDADKNVGVPKPYLGNKSVQWGRININNLSLIKLTPSDLHRYRLADGDLLVCEGGDVGRSAIWSGQLEECYFQKALHRVRSRGGYSAVLLRYLLEFYSKTGFLLNFATQTSIAHLPKDKFEVMPLPKPSIGEQKAIAEALSDADALIEGLERLIAKKRLIKQGAMQELLTGRRRLPGFSGKWCPVTLFEMADSNKKNFDDGDWIEAEHIASTGIRLIQTGNVGTGTFINSNRKYIHPESFTNLGCKEVYPGDVLICRLADPPGRACVVPELGEEKMLTSVDVTIYRPNKMVADRKLLTEFMSQPSWFARVNEASGGTTRKRIARSQLGRMTILMPPIKEQQALSRLFADIDAEIKVLENRLEKAGQIKEGMMQNLLTGRIRLV